MDKTGELLLDLDDLPENDRGGSSGDSDDSEDEIEEYMDEFGRTRREKRSKIPDADVVRARIADKTYQEHPQNVIYDSSYVPVFRVSDIERQAFENAGKKPPVAVYDATKEVRNKGVAFYSFSTDHDIRSTQLKELEDEHSKAEEERRKQNEISKRRKEEIKRRREEIKEKRNEKLEGIGEKWLADFHPGV